jgi:hypothetical protein
MVRGKDGYCSVGAETSGAHESVQNGRRTSAIAWLRYDLRTSEISQERLIEVAMALLDHDEGALDWYQLRHPVPRILEPRQPAYHRTELLRHVVLSGDKPSHGAHTKTLAAGKNDRRAR